MTKAMIEELRAAPPVSDGREAMETETNGDQRDGDEEPTGEKPRVLEEKESGTRFKDKDITRAGQSAALLLVRKSSMNDTLLRLDIKWLEGFDSKIAVLINRDGVDPRDYGGKDQQEWVHSYTSPAHVVSDNRSIIGNSYLPQNRTSGKRAKENIGVSTARSCLSHPPSLRSMLRINIQNS